MALRTRHRATISTTLVPIVGEAEANALLAEFPASDDDEPVTRSFLRGVSAGRCGWHDRGVDVSFRPLRDDDLPVLHGWLNEPGVVAWWEGDDVSWDGVVDDYGSAGRADRGDRTEHWIATCEGRDIGWIQCYAAADEPEETQDWWDLGVDRTAAGIDYLVADPGARGRGVGSAMIRAFVVDVVFGRHPEWTQAAAAPFVANAASWKALRKAGFRHVADVDHEDGAWSLHVIDRSDV